MPIGIRNGTEIGYYLREVAEMLGQRDSWCAEGRALIHQLGDYFSRENLVEMLGGSWGYDVVSGGAVRAYCYDCGLNVPPELAGMRPSPQETAALVRRMLRDREAVSDAASEVLPGQPASVPGGERKHGGGRPETAFIEWYIKERRSKGLTLHAMRNGFVHHVIECIEAGDRNCPFIAYDPAHSMFTVWGADGEEREVLLANVQRSIGDAEKRISRRKQS